jgi:hypothetical protein
MQSVMLNAVAQGARNRFLSGNFFKCLRAPFAGDNLVRHKGLNHLQLRGINSYLLIRSNCKSTQ